MSPPTHHLLVKLGGSLITDKTKVEHAHKPMIRRLAREIKAAREARPDLRLVLGHGSGSFGHVAAKKHGTRDGVKDRSGWLGYAEVAAAAARLNQIVTDMFVAEGVPVVSLPPSASARCDDGRCPTSIRLCCARCWNMAWCRWCKAMWRWIRCAARRSFPPKMSSSISSANFNRRTFCWPAKWRACLNAAI